MLVRRHLQYLRCVKVPFDDSFRLVENRTIKLSGPVAQFGSALPWHGRGRRFDPDQVHHLFNNLADPPRSAWPEIGRKFEEASAVSTCFGLRLSCWLRASTVTYTLSGISCL